MRVALWIVVFLVTFAYLQGCEPWYWNNGYWKTIGIQCHAGGRK